jgi:hypothetical protein
VLEELGQGVLEQRQRARLVEHVGDDLGEQALLERDAGSSRGLGDRPLDRFGRQRRHRHDTVAKQLGELPVEQRPVVEIRSQRDHDTQAAMRVADRLLEDREDVRAEALVRDEGEQLFQLIEDQHELGVVAGQDTLHRPQQPALVALELLDQARRRVDRDAQQARLELLERIRPQREHGDLPVLRAGQPTAAKLWDQPGANDGGLAASTRTDKGQESTSREPIDEQTRQRLPSEEVRSVGLPEGAQSLVRVTRLRFGRPRSSSRLPGFARRTLKRRILAEHLALQHAQRRRGLDAQLLHQLSPRRLVDLERLHLPTGPVEREHQLGTQLLPQRMLARQLFELCNQRTVQAERQICLDPPLECSQTQLLKPADHRLREGLVGEVRQRRTAPESERVTQRGGRDLDLAAADCPRRLLHPHFETRRVELSRIQVNQIARRPSLEKPAHGSRPVSRIKQLPQLRDMVADLRDRRRRNLLPVQIACELLDRNHTICVEQQHRQHTTLLGPSQPNRLGVREHLERAEDAELQPHRNGR